MYFYLKYICVIKPYMGSVLLLQINYCRDMIINIYCIVYAADATMQAMLSDKHGRTLVVEPGIGWREDEGRYSLITNYSILAPESTRPFVMPEDDRYEKASKMLNIYGNHFTVNNAFSILQAVCQEGIWATRVSFVYSAEENAVYYVQNNNFSQIGKYEF